MKSTYLFLLLHLGTLAKDSEDVEKLIADLLNKKPVDADLQTFLSDVGTAFSSGMIAPPLGMSTTDVATALAEIASVLCPPAAAPASSTAPSS